MTAPSPLLLMNDVRAILPVDASLTVTRGALVAVTGASGYVGARLVPALLEAGYRVRCLARDERKVHARPWSSANGVECMRCSLEDRASVTHALRDCDAAYYLVHSMLSAGNSFADRDQAYARTFGLAAREAGVGRLIYLGGLGEMGPGLSAHLASRRHVEEALRSGGVPLTTLRAAMIIGSGSASFEILRYLVERLPVMVTPRWVRTESQPIGIRDVVRYLVETLRTPESAGRDLDIGGADIVRYDELMRAVAEELGLRPRVVLPVSVLSPGLSSRWIHLVTPIDRRLARPLAEGLRNRLVCRNDDAERLMPGPLLSSRDAIARAVAVQRAGRSPSSWSDAGAMPGDPSWAGGTEFHDRRERLVWAPIEQVFETLSAIGGDNGYFAARTLWRLRGALDRLVGGPGLRRGRRNARELRFGDAVDFWRVTGIVPGRRLELTAEMRLPGEARLVWELEPRPGGRTLVTQTATFRPRGVAGLAYWWSVWPVHGRVFESMVRGLAQHAESAESTLAGPPLSRPTRGLRLHRRETVVPLGIDETFAFFGDARNLDAITPPWVGFRILTPTPVDMRAGTLIDYSIRIHGVPVRWRTEITAWDPPHHFIDVQRRGPYRWWHHDHRFEPCAEGTRVIDEVEYAAPAGALLHPLFVDRDVRRIFDHRQARLRAILSRPRSPTESRAREADMACAAVTPA